MSGAVIRLPSAARRQVKQPRNAAGRTKVAEMLAPGVAAGRKTVVQAFRVFRTTRTTVGASIDLDNAILLLCSEGKL